jgi:2-methylisocitrate lyase-like PEP mutase family enzyme
MASILDRAQTLRQLHHDPAILVLVNVWDVASARTVAALPGCRAIATGSWPIAASLGVPDGERLTRDEMIAVVARIVAAVDLPVTADLEAGYGATAVDVGETVARALGIGIVGANIEDANRPTEQAAARIAAARARADAEGVPFVLNARLDMRIATSNEVDEAVTRARAYLDAGADCVYPIEIGDPVVLGDFTARIAAPVNAYGAAGGPSVADLEALGVARVSFGPGPQGVAMAALGRVGTVLLGGGTLDADLAFRPPEG